MSATFDPPVEYVPEWSFTQDADGHRMARRARDGLTVEPLASFAADADPVPAGVLLWVLGADAP